MVKVDPISLWRDFLEKDYRIDRFGAQGQYDESIFESSDEIGYKGLFQSARISQNRDFFNYTFDTYLRERGFVPDPVIDISMAAGSEYRQRRLPNWIKYSHPQLGDLWVNYYGHTSSEGAWQDVLLTNSPEQLRVFNEFRNDTLTQGLLGIIQRS